MGRQTEEMVDVPVCLSACLFGPRWRAVGPDVKLREGIELRSPLVNGAVVPSGAVAQQVGDIVDVPPIGKPSLLIRREGV